MKKETFFDIAHRCIKEEVKGKKVKTYIIRTNMPSVSKKGDGAAIVSFFPNSKEFKKIVEKYLNSALTLPKIKDKIYPTFIEIPVLKECYYVPIEYITYIHVVYY